MADPCTAGFSTSVSTIGIVSPSLEKQYPGLASLYNTLGLGGRVRFFAVSIVFRLSPLVWVEIMAVFWIPSSSANAVGADSRGLAWRGSWESSGVAIFKATEGGVAGIGKEE